MSEESPPIHEPHLDAHPVRSALAGGKKKKDKQNRALTWDEHAIEEHDQLRGTRMKVRESRHHADGNVNSEICTYIYEPVSEFNTKD